jgi:hypothetical protein
MRGYVFGFFVVVLIIQALTISGAAQPDYRLLVLLNFLMTLGLVFLSYWVWKDGEKLED